MRLGLLLALPLLGAPARGQIDLARYQEEFDRGVGLLRQGKHAEGIAAFERCLEMAPDEPDATYNIACGYALSGEKGKALEWLGKAAERGFVDAKLAADDPDLNPIRGEEGFPPILGKIGANATRARQRADEAAKEARVPVVREPPGYDRSKPTPLLVVLHGLGGSKAEFVRPFEDAAAEAGFLLFSVQGTVPTREGGYAWYDGGYAQAPGRYEGGILEVVRQAKRERAIDAERIYLLGFSEGALMAVHAGLRAPGLFRGAVGLGGAYHPDALVGTAALRTAAERGFRAYLMVGDKDAEALKESTKRAAEALRAAGLKVEEKSYAGGHALPEAASRKAAILEALRWLDRNAPAPETKPASGERKG
ncbi:MAG TPA: alpha/beta fold hydrolase [Planctomycetota bacterium]|jgi:phospholipase/carboxylesterase|nr:alpha/beta fold hydrolase [Planctomycetota bacterium]